MLQQDLLLRGVIIGMGISTFVFLLFVIAVFEPSIKKQMKRIENLEYQIKLREMVISVMGEQHD